MFDFLTKNRARVSCLHAKEYRIATKDEPTMGEGDVPFPEIIDLALEKGWQLIVEHEPGEAALEGVRASARHLKQQLLANGGDR